MVGVMETKMVAMSDKNLDPPLVALMAKKWADLKEMPSVAMKASEKVCL